MNPKRILLVMFVLTGIAACLLAVKLVRVLRTPAPTAEPVQFIDEVGTHIPEPQPGAPANYSAIVKRNIFFQQAPVQTQETNKDSEPNEEQKKSAEIKMLDSYPETWPRLKLTGVFLLNKRWGAIISGGSAVTSSKGNNYDSLYYEGDSIGSGVTLGTVSKNSVVLVQNNRGWTIMLGAEPPVVVKKK